MSIRKCGRDALYPNILMDTYVYRISPPPPKHRNIVVYPQIIAIRLFVIHNLTS